MNLNKALGYLALTMAAITAGCVTDIGRTSDHVALQPCPKPAETIILHRQTAVRLRSGYSVSDIRPETSWRCIGSIPQGQVFKPIDAVLMVDAGDRHDAYLVVRGNQLQGVYLPVESAFVAARSVDLGNAFH